MDPVLLAVILAIGFAAWALRGPARVYAADLLARRVTPRRVDLPRPASLAAPHRATDEASVPRMSALSDRYPRLAMTRTDRRREQEELAREYARQQAERPAVDTERRQQDRRDPAYCPLARDNEHTWRKATNDPAGVRRCQSCGATKGPDGVVVRLGVERRK